MALLDQERDGTAQSLFNDRILYVANDVSPSLQLSFLTPLQAFVERDEIVIDILTEADLAAQVGKDNQRGTEAASWVRDKLDAFKPTIIVLCRYSAAQAETILNWARRSGVPTIFHIDDDLLNVPLELGAAKYAAHNHPDRVSTIRYLRDNATIVFCSTEALRQKLFDGQPPANAIAGDIFCAHEIVADPKDHPRRIIGYMGSKRAHDLDLVLPVLIKTLDEFPDVSFDLFGTTPMPGALSRFGDRARAIGPNWDYASFLPQLASLGWTLGICPLVDMPFNKVKADTKWVEYTAAGIAVVATRGMTYDRCCADGCGILAETDDEWAAAFSLLLTDKAANRALVTKAQDRLRREYTPAKLVDQIATAFALARSLSTAHDETAANDAPKPLDQTQPVTADAEPPPAKTLAPEVVSALPTPDSTSHEPAGLDKLHMDVMDGNQVVGWAWSPQDKQHDIAQRLRLEILCGDVRLGFCSRNLARPDVDDFVEDPNGAKGFALPIGCLNVFWPLMRCDGGLRPVVKFGTAVQSPYEVNPQLRDLASYRSMRTAHAASAWRIADVWWANSRLLKFRTDESAEGQRMELARLRLYQPVSRLDGRFGLALADETPLRSGKAVIAVGTMSAVMPILLVAVNENEEILFADLIPFPSLLRGGLHDSEIAVVAPEGGTLSDLRQLSDAYVAESLGWGTDAVPHTIGEIGVDLIKATGAEPIFDPSIVLWLTRGLGIPVVADNVDKRLADDLGDRTFGTHASTRLKAHGSVQPRSGRAKLALPSHAIPTIAALVSKRIALPPRRQPAPYIAVDDAFAKRRWFVSYPALSAAVSATVSSCASDAPFLSTHQSESPGTERDIWETNIPVAIAFRDFEATVPVQKAFPVPKDKPSILPASIIGANRPASVLVFLRDRKESIDLLLASVAGQVTQGGHDLVLAVANRQPHEVAALRETLGKAMPDRATIVEVENSLNWSGAIALAASAATGASFIILDPSIVLHDYRTIQTLGNLALQDGVGTVGCMVLRPQSVETSPPAFKSAGYFPGRIDFAAAPHLALSELDCSDVLVRTIYPVVANSPLCFAIAAAAWTSVAGLDDTLFPSTHAEIALATRLAAQGRTNLCTTLLSAYSLKPASKQRLHDIRASARLGFWELAGAMRTSTIVRSF